MDYNENTSFENWPNSLSVCMAAKVSGYSYSVIKTLFEHEYAKGTRGFLKFGTRIRAGKWTFAQLLGIIPSNKAG